MFTLIATKEYDHGAGLPYYPMWKETYLYKTDAPMIGKNGMKLFYIRTMQLSLGGTWLTNDDAMKFIADSWIPRQRAS